MLTATIVIAPHAKAALILLIVVILVLVGASSNNDPKGPDRYA